MIWMLPTPYNLSIFILSVLIFVPYTVYPCHISHPESTHFEVLLASHTPYVFPIELTTPLPYLYLLNPLFDHVPGMCHCITYCT